MELLNVCGMQPYELFSSTNSFFFFFASATTDQSFGVTIILLSPSWHALCMKLEATWGFDQAEFQIIRVPHETGQEKKRSRSDHRCLNLSAIDTCVSSAQFAFMITNGN